MKKHLTVIMAVSILTGCSTINYEDAETKFSRTSFGNKLSIGKLEVESKDGLKVVKMEGYSNDQVEAIKIAVEAAVAAAVKAAVPVAP